MMTEKSTFKEFQRTNSTYSFISGFFIDDIISNIELIQENVTTSNLKVSSRETLHNYLWWYSFKEFLNNIYKFKIDENLKETLYSISKKINVDNESFVSFINSNYEAIFGEKEDDDNLWIIIFYETITLCYGKFSKEIGRNVFDYLEKKHALRILSHFENCADYYSSHRESFESLFTGLEYTSLFDDNIYVDVLKKLNKKSDSFLKSKAEFICKRTLDSIIAMNLNEDSYEILQITSMFAEYEKLSIQYQLKIRSDYAILKKQLTSTLDRFIKKHGEHYKSGPYDFETALNFFKENTDPLRFINFTHSFNNGDLSNSLNYILTAENKNKLSEVFNDLSRNKSDKYPYFKQDLMQLNMWVRSSILNLILLDKDLAKDMLNYVYNISLHIQKEYFEDSIDIEHEITGELDNVLSIVSYSQQGHYETDQTKTLIRGISMSICATIEKIIRNIVIKENKTETYIDPDELTLGNCFKFIYKMPSVSEGLKYHLEFYLLKEVNLQVPGIDKPGKNIRNILMHGIDDIDDKFYYETLMNLVYFLVSLINDIYVYTNPYEN